jgi:hypothetical protein
MTIGGYFHRTGIGSWLHAHHEGQVYARGNTTILLATFEGAHEALSYYK